MAEANDHLVVIKAKLAKARSLVAAICQGDHKWRMSVPVQADDSDMVLCDTFNDTDWLIAEVERLRKGYHDLQELSRHIRLPGRAHGIIEALVGPRGEQ